MNLFQSVATACKAWRYCRDNGKAEWEGRWDAYLTRIERECLPRGSGFDAGTTIDREKSGPDRLVFLTAFHHLNERGSYDGWTEHTVTIIPTFHGPVVKVGGRNRNNVKDYVADVFCARGGMTVPFNP